MNWFQTAFKQLFGISDKMETDEMGLPKVSVEIPMPVVKMPKADRNISEPIISFVQCVQKNPKRFKVLYDYEHFSYMYTDNTLSKSVFPVNYHYRLADTKTNESWTLIEGYTCPIYDTLSEFKHSCNPEWITEDEREYLIDSIKAIFHNRKARKETLKKLKKDRRNRDERNRLKKIYCDTNH